MDIERVNVPQDFCLPPILDLKNQSTNTQNKEFLTSFFEILLEQN